MIYPNPMHEGGIAIKMQVVKSNKYGVIYKYKCLPIKIIKWIKFLFSKINR